MTDSTPPPPPQGGGLKYAIIGLLLLLAAGGIWFLTAPEEPPPAPVATVQVDAGPPAPSNPTFQPEFVIPDEEPDAGPQEEAPIKRRIVYVDRRGDWDCDGDIPVASIRSVIAEQRTQVRACYERALKVNNTLQGRVDVRVKIGRDGRVSATRVTGSLRDNDVFSCVRSLARNWSFPAPSGGDCAVVDAPFTLTPRP